MNDKWEEGLCEKKYLLRVRTSEKKFLFFSSNIAISLQWKIVSTGGRKTDSGVVGGGCIKKLHLQLEIA